MSEEKFIPDPCIQEGCDKLQWNNLDSDRCKDHTIAYYYPNADGNKPEQIIEKLEAENKDLKKRVWELKQLSEDGDNWCSLVDAYAKVERGKLSTLKNTQEQLTKYKTGLDEIHNICEKWLNGAVQNFDGFDGFDGFYAIHKKIKELREGE